MGLDMYAFTTSETIPAVDFKDPADSAELPYWRKHPNLHGWMEQPYRQKGGKSEGFIDRPRSSSSSARRQCLRWSGPFPPRRDLCNPDG